MTKKMAPEFARMLDWHRKSGATGATIVVQQELPTLDEIKEWQKNKGAKEFTHRLGSDGRVVQIAWSNTRDHDLFIRWVKKRNEGPYAKYSREQLIRAYQAAQEVNDEPVLDALAAEMKKRMESK